MSVVLALWKHTRRHYWGPVRFLTELELRKELSSSELLISLNQIHDLCIQQDLWLLSGCPLVIWMQLGLLNHLCLFIRYYFPYYIFLKGRPYTAHRKDPGNLCLPVYHNFIEIPFNNSFFYHYPDTHTRWIYLIVVQSNKDSLLSFQ